MRIPRKPAETQELFDKASLNYEKGSVPVIFEELTYIAEQQQGHAGRVTDERKDKGPPQVGG